MKIDQKYRLEGFPFNLRVVRAFDFEIEPVLLLEKDVIGNNFLSYLTFSDEEIEQRAYIQVSEDRLNEIVSCEISLADAYKNPENNFLLVAEYLNTTGDSLNSYLIPISEFIDVEIIPPDYTLDYQLEINSVELDDSELLDYSERKNKLVLDFYLQGQNLINSIKPYAFYKIFTPVVEIIKSMLEFDGRNADKYLAFSNLRHSSFGVTIELNYSHDLFMERESRALDNLIMLLNAQNEEDFKVVLYNTKNDKYLRHYKSIIKAIIDNNADLHTAYANPIFKTIKISELDKARAEVAQSLIDQTLDVIQDVEEINGSFLEIDIDRKEPSFKIYSFEDSSPIKGKFELSIIDKIKSDFINIGKESYTFTIKTIYYPETTLKSEEIKRFMIDYKKVD
ncbi:DUF6575 domain-containing protein [Allomuricauda sp. NBRC 101325]|uniref:DUF6575 domain-containing protein n=1 Tax=Allomuricauda sp. NBRC 101325 TaxID=1113758 RepID=UPI0024A6084F|nr:DUF6575 domain-containing protein [Muricauda sp. NBRC 101325]GLU45002.1 hypothetical protein Musp01_26260 [Muricauda sp. NBRC 101325]